MSLKTALLRRVAPLLLLASPLAADTIVVDAAGGPGSSFTDIPPAIAAAQPGDVILVRVGVYSAFTVDRGVLVIGEGDAASYTGSVRVGTATLDGVPAGATAGLVNLRISVSPARVRLLNCAGTVVLEDLAWSIYTTGLVQDCADVRLHGSASTLQGGLQVIGSRMEIASASIRGRAGDDGQSGNPWWPATDGALGLMLGNWSSGGEARVHLVRSDVYGGDGGSNSTAGDGATGVRVSPLSQLVLAGYGESTIQGGDGGWGDYCYMDGNPGDGLVNDRGQVWRSGELLLPGTIAPGQCGVPADGYVYLPGSGSLDQPVVPWDPTLDLTGPRTPGSTVQVTVRARDGAFVVLATSSTPAVIDDGKTHVERLVGLAWIASLGRVVSGNQLQFSARVPANAQVGRTQWMQAWVVLPGGSLRRSNSVPLIVR